MTRSWRFWLAASCVAHAGAVGIGFLATSGTTDRHTSSTAAAVSVQAPLDPSRATGTLNGRVAERSDPTPFVAIDPPDVSLGGSVSAQNLSTLDPGQGGDGRSLHSSQLLATRDEGVDLSPNLLNTLRADQEQRIRTSRDRLSPQFRRSTPTPGYDPRISLSDGVLLFRTRRSELLPERGAVASPGHASVAGESPHPAATLGSSQPLLLAAPLGGAPRLAAGIAAPTNGRSARVAGPTAIGHASIEQGHASTTSELAAPRPSDNVDAEALATRLLTNSVAAASHAGPERDQGTGGVGGGGAAGSGGGATVGGRAHPYGEGEGWISLDAPDARYQLYFQRLNREIFRLWANAFPREDALAMRQGVVILRFVIGSDGRVRDIVVQRHSGVDGFDRNVVSVMTGARLPPIPAELGMRELRVSKRFDFRNPYVR